MCYTQMMFMDDDEPPPVSEDDIVEELKQLNKKELVVVEQILKLQNAIEKSVFFLSLYANALKEKQWLENEVRYLKEQLKVFEERLADLSGNENNNEEQ